MRVGKRIVFALVSTFLLAGPAMAQESNLDQGKKRMTMEESLLLPSWGSYSLSPDNTKVVFTKREMDDGQVDWYLTQGCVRKRVAVPQGGLLLWDSRVVHAGAKPLKGRASQP